MVAAWDLALDRVWGHYALSSGVIARSLRLGPSDMVLDVGGGTGGVSARLRGSVRGVGVIEPSEALTQRGRRRHRGVAFAVGDGRRLPVLDASVDHVLLIEVLHHVDDAATVLEEASRVLRPGGSILVEETGFDGPVGRIRLWIERALLEGVWPRSRAELLGGLAALGFRGEVLEHEGFVIVARRA
ncbi:MAG: class I SAM-dependent methyltransferase [Candidatus Limnocylindria bacterium]